MQLRAGSGWQYALTDLSLILFLIAAGNLARVPAKAVAAPNAAEGQPALAEPVAVWRQSADAPTLAAWLAVQPADARQRLTISAHYAGSDARQPAEAAARLLAEAGPRSGPVRLLVEPGAANDMTATLTWDAPPSPPAEGAPR